MPIRTNHKITHPTWFITFTCYNWIPLFEISQSYDEVYKWLALINKKYQIKTLGFVIMPNHVHLLLYLPSESLNLNTIISNAKRFMAYEIIKRLNNKNHPVLDVLAKGCTDKERAKGQIHKAFEPSFDAKVIYSPEFFDQKLIYIHCNPLSKRWNLCHEQVSYPHSSAAFYELNKAHPHVEITNYAEYWC